MKAFLLGCGALLSTALAGCYSHDCYQIEVRPEGQSFDRKLVCWHADQPGEKGLRPLSSDQLDRIGKLYSKPPTKTEGKKLVFSGRFQGNTPADVGGAGSYTQFPSSLGSASCYVERFRGDDDLESQMSKRRQAAGRLADFALGWMGAELGQDPAFPRLQTFLDVDFRRDLRNVAEYAWAGAVTTGAQPDSWSEWFVRLAQYFGERGYFQPQQVPSLFRSLSDNDPTPLLHHLQRFLAGKMGVAAEQPIPASLAFLGDLSRLKESFGKYAPTSEMLRKRLEAESKKPGPQGPTTEQLAEAFSLELAELVGFELAGAGDLLDVKLICPTAPYATNGKWDETGAVTWSGKRLFPKAALPVFCFALWSVPDRAVQEKCFGKVLLTGERLAEYVMWYRGLDREQAREWEEFLGGLQPRDDLKAGIQGFRFRSDPKPDPKRAQEVPASLADTPRRLILTALEGKGR